MKAAPRSDEERCHRGSLLRDTVGVSDRTPRVTWCAHLATLRHFEHKVRVRPESDPLIPCERRLREMEIPEFQEVTFEARFGNREHDRPYGHFSVTLAGFD